MLEVKGVRKAYGATVALDGVSFKADPGRVLAIVGENGSGKSTLMKVLAGETLPDEGSVSWQGRTGQAEKFFLVHQELTLCPHLTGAENIFLGLEKGFFFSPTKRIKAAKEILQKLGFGHIDPSVKTGSLPVSQRQVLEIARAEARNASIILFDEPTSSLTASDKEKLYELVARLKESGKLVLYISHFLEEIRAVSDDIVILRDGAKVAEGLIAEISDDEILQHMVGRKISEIFPRSERLPGEVILDLNSVFAKNDKAKDVSFQVRRGEVVGLAGLNGAGRTELLRAIMRLDPILTGSVKVKGSGIPKVSQMWSNGAGYVSEERKIDGLVLDLTIAENIDLPAKRGLTRNPAKQSQATQKWVEAMRVKCENSDQKVGSLSGGNQQKVAFARLLHADCDLFLLDEPTRGIDVGSKADLYRKIDEAAARGCGILMTSSYLPELLGVCDRIGVMNRGSLVSLVNANEATQASLLRDCLK